MSPVIVAASARPWLGLALSVTGSLVRDQPAASFTIPRWLYALPLPIVLIAAWQLATGGKSYSLIPPPSTVVLTAWDYAFSGIRNDTYSGTLGVTSQVGHGSVFFFTLPIARLGVAYA